MAGENQAPPVQGQGDDSFMSGQQSAQQPQQGMPPQQFDPVSMLLAQGGTNALARADGGGIDPQSIQANQQQQQQLQQLQQQQGQGNVSPNPQERHVKMMGLLSNFLGSLGAGMSAAAEHPGNPGAQTLAAIGGSLSNPRQVLLQDRQYQLQLMQMAKEIEQLRAMSAYHTSLANASMQRANTGEERVQQQGELLPFKEQQMSRFGVAPGAQEFTQKPGGQAQPLASGGGIVQITPDMVEIAKKGGMDISSMQGQGVPMTLWNAALRGIGAATKEVNTGEGVMERNAAKGTSERIGTSPGVATAREGAYWQAVYNVVPAQDQAGQTYYVPKIYAPGQAPATSSFQIMQGKQGLVNFKQALNRIKENLDQLDDETQRGLAARTLQQIGEVHDPGVISSFIGQAVSSGMDAKTADLVAATLQAKEFVGANKQFAGNFRGSEPLYQRMVSNIASPRNAKEFNMKLIDQDIAATERIEQGLGTFQGGNPQYQGINAPRNARSRMTKSTSQPSGPQAGEREVRDKDGNLKGYTTDGKTYSRRVQ